MNDRTKKLLRKSAYTNCDCVLSYMSVRKLFLNDIPSIFKKKKKNYCKQHNSTADAQCAIVVSLCTFVVSGCALAVSQGSVNMSWPPHGWLVFLG